MLDDFRKAENAQAIISLLNTKYKDHISSVNVFRQQTLNRMILPEDFTLRVFVAACQNLSAVDNKIAGYKYMVAGD